MGTTFLIKAKTKEGFEIHFAGEFPQDFDLLYNRLTDADFGYTTISTVVAPPPPTQPAAQTGGALTCQFCGKDVEPVKFGKIDQTAQEVATGRAGKMGKMGKVPGPVCGKCWKQGGHAKAWDDYYTAQQG